MAAVVAGCRSGNEFVADNYIPAEPADTADFPNPDGGFALAIGSDTLQADHMVLPVLEHFRPHARQMSFVQFSQNFRPQIQQMVTNEIISFLMYQQAGRQLDSGMDRNLNKMLDGEMRRFVDSFDGDYAKAEQQLAQMGMDWQDFRRHQRKMLITRSYLSSRLKDQPVTYRQLRERYERVKDRRFAVQCAVEFSLIEIRPDRLDRTDGLSPGEKARQLASQLREKLDKGADFAELAKEYSHDFAAGGGGRWEKINPDSLAPPYDMIAQKAMELETGDITGPIAAAGRFFLVRLEGKQQGGYQPFEQVQQKLKDEILDERHDQQLNELAGKIAQYANPQKKAEFIDYILARIYHLSRS